MDAYKFTDDQGTEWVVAFTLDVAERLQDNGVDVLPPTKEFFDDMFRGGPFTVKLLWACVEDTAKLMDPPVTRQGFLKRIGGAEYTQAKNAIWSACSDFIQHDPTAYYLLMEVWNRVKEKMETESEKINEFLEKEETETTTRPPETNTMDYPEMNLEPVVKVD